MVSIDRLFEFVLADILPLTSIVVSRKILTPRGNQATVKTLVTVVRVQY
jgi:hypothetical protein